MTRHLSLAALALLAGCSSLTTTQQAALITAGATVASVAAAQNTTVAQVVSGGQLFCSGATVFAVADTSVIGKSAAYVAAACKAVDAIAVPVSPPTNAATVPVVSA